jgi:hypothetical protein
MTMIRSAVFVLPLTFALSLGCGDDDGGGAAKSSGVDGAKTVSELSKDDAIKLCKWQGTLYGVPTEEELCTAFALFTASDKASCETAVDECLKESDEGGDDAGDDIEGGDPCETAPEEFKTCKATVAEVEACLKADADAVNSAKVSCDDAGKDVPDSDDEELPECKKIADSCPEV